MLLTDRNTTSSNVPGNNSLLSSETSAVPRLPSEDQEEEVEEDPGKEFPTTADHFLVCVFNVSSKVSYR